MKKGFIIAGSFILICLVVFVIIFGGGNETKENTQELIGKESEDGLEVIEPEQWVGEEEQSIFIAPGKVNTNENATENKNFTNKDNVDNIENNKTTEGDIEENEEDDGKTKMGDFF